MSPVPFFDAQAGGVEQISLGQAGRGSLKPIEGFVRTASGMAFGVCYKDGGGEVWKRHPGYGIVRVGRWPSGDISVIFDGGMLPFYVLTLAHLRTSLGHAVAAYVKNTSQLTIYHLPSNTAQSLEIPGIDSLVMLSYTSIRASLLAVATDFSVTQIHCTLPSQYSGMRLNFLGPTSFPAPTPGDVPTMILPVDPMGWSFAAEDSQEMHVSLLSISKTGVLAFWTISDDGQWRATGQVHTQRTGIKLARCSTAKKSALGGFKGYAFCLFLKISMAKQLSVLEEIKKN